MRMQRGFTLIELMIVVVVIAVLAAIAVPNYLEQSRKGRRADAVRAVGQYQLAMERWRAENPSYANCSGSACGSGTYPTAPTSEFYTVPTGGTSASASAYSITLQPTGKQSGDRCGNLVSAYDPANSRTGKPTWSGDADCNQ